MICFRTSIWEPFFWFRVMVVDDFDDDNPKSLCMISALILILPMCKSTLKIRYNKLKSSFSNNSRTSFTPTSIINTFFRYIWASTSTSCIFTSYFLNCILHQPHQTPFLRINHTINNAYVNFIKKWMKIMIGHIMIVKNINNNITLKKNHVLLTIDCTNHIKHIGTRKNAICIGNNFGNMHHCAVTFWTLKTSRNAFKYASWIDENIDHIEWIILNDVVPSNITSNE